MAATAPLARLLVALLFATVGSLAARADCLTVAGLPAPRLLPAAFSPAAGGDPEGVRITFLGHASFLIETPGGASAVTDYNGVYRPPYVPDVVTMNNAHSTHFTDHPDPAIRHVLRGWDPAGGMARHDIQVKDLRVRNVPTNVRDEGGTRVAGNSIFVFEAAGLCIAHVGHLHHDLTDLHLAELGMIDVLMVPVDGSYTARHETMLRVIDQLHPSVVIPMHWFIPQRLDEFLTRLAPTRAIDRRPSPTVTLARATLPQRAVIVLPGEH